MCDDWAERDLKWGLELSEECGYHGITRARFPFWKTLQAASEEWPGGGDSIREFWVLILELLLP